MIDLRYWLACFSTECSKHASSFVCKWFKENEGHINLHGFFLVKQKLFLYKHRLIQSAGIINLILLKASETTIANNLMVCFLSDT